MAGHSKELGWGSWPAEASMFGSFEAAMAVAAVVEEGLAFAVAVAVAKGSGLLVAVGPDSSLASSFSFSSNSNCCFGPVLDSSQQLEGSSFAVAEESGFVELGCSGLELKVAVADPMALDPCC